MRKRGREGGRVGGKKYQLCLQFYLDLVGIHGGVSDENANVLQSLWLINSNFFLQ